MANEPIDVVITWVDGSDPKWLEEKAKYTSAEKDDSSFVAGKNRYQDNGLLKYWFRGIEKFLPWAHKVHFVTFGHLPSWLDTSNPKLAVVRHEDFIPAEYLPTFNSNAILLNLHRIPDLVDRFIFFNDDMFAIKPCAPTLFFRDGLPCDMAVMEPITAPNLDPFYDMMINNVMTINAAFKKKQVVKSNLSKWFNIRYGLKNVVRNLFMSPYHSFPGFCDCHLPNAYLKGEFSDYWGHNQDICHQTCLHKFRDSEDITEWAIRYWQLAKGVFSPINKDKLGIFTSMKNNSAVNFVKNKGWNYPLVCLNDECSEEQLSIYVDFFESILPKPSQFERKD